MTLVLHHFQCQVIQSSTHCVSLTPWLQWPSEIRNSQSTLQISAFKQYDNNALIQRETDGGGFLLGEIAGVPELSERFVIPRHYLCIWSSLLGLDTLPNFLFPNGFRISKSAINISFCSFAACIL
jgi:hypothetical protein